MWSQVPAGIRTELDARWNEPHRRHHNAQHRDEMLTALDLLAASGEHFDQRPVVLAVWFHDAVYDVFGSDNETASARLAADLLGDADPDLAEVIRLVELTTTHDPDVADTNGAALSDADLWVLGTDPERYYRYSDAIRAEYHQVPDDLFAAGRAAVLRDLLGHEHIYATATARTRWEDRARANLSNEIRRLLG